MQDFTIWNWIAYGALAIATFGVAIEGAVRRHPDMTERLHNSRIGVVVSFGPLVLVSVATVIFLGVMLFGSDPEATPGVTGTADDAAVTELRNQVAALEAETKALRAQLARENVAASWGVDPSNGHIFIEIRGNDLAEEYSPTYTQVALGCRAMDNTVSYANDTQRQMSGWFPLSGERTRIDVVPSQSLLQRLKAGGGAYECGVLLAPAGEILPGQQLQMIASIPHTYPVSRIVPRERDE